MNLTKRISIFIIFLIFQIIIINFNKAEAAEKLRLYGFFDLEFEKADNFPGDKKGSFDQHRFNLLLEAPLNNKFSVKAHIEYEHSPKISSGSGKGDMTIEWAYAEYIINNNFRIRGGTFLTPFGLYNEVHDASPAYEFIRIPYGIYRTDTVGGFAIFPKFGTGINLTGNHFIGSNLNLTYDIYTANGENDTKNEAEDDENYNKAIGGRISITPYPDLTLGGSYYNGKKGTPAAPHTAFAGSLDYAPHPFHFRTEYASSELSGQREISWYAEGTYTIKKFNPYLRYGLLDPDDRISNDLWKVAVLGCAYKIQPDIILKLEDRIFEGDTANTAVKTDYNEIGAALAVAF